MNAGTIFLLMLVTLGCSKPSRDSVTPDADPQADAEEFIATLQKNGTIIKIDSLAGEEHLWLASPHTTLTDKEKSDIGRLALERFRPDPADRGLIRLYDAATGYSIGTYTHHAGWMLSSSPSNASPANATQ